MNNLLNQTNQNNYEVFLFNHKLEDNLQSYEKYLNFKTENSKLDIGLFITNLEELEEDLTILNIKKDEYICFENMKWEYNDSYNGGIHIWDRLNKDNEVNIEVNFETIIKDSNNGINVDDKWSLEVL